MTWFENKHCSIGWKMSIWVKLTYLFLMVILLKAIILNPTILVPAVRQGNHGNFSRIKCSISESLLKTCLGSLFWKQNNLLDSFCLTQMREYQQWEHHKINFAKWRRVGSSHISFWYWLWTELVSFISKVQK